MLIGLLKEIKDHEYRVGLTPASVKELVYRGHKVIIEHNAGFGSGALDADYVQAGATIVADKEAVFAQAELIIKVKEPQPVECKLLKPHHIIFCYLHLAPDLIQTELLQQSGATAIAYETVTASNNTLPLLAPMSEIAGRLAIQAGAHCLEKVQGGRGILLGGVPGVLPAKVVVLGGGAAGTQAAKMAQGLGASVTVLDKSLPRLRELDDMFQGKVRTCYSTAMAIEEQIYDADLVIGAVLVPGAHAPKLVSRKMLQQLKPGLVLIDLAIDQGGCFETSRPTNYSKPTFIAEDAVHYCVVNMPAGVPRTATLALNNATLPFIIQLADYGYKQACAQNVHLLNGLNICQGEVTCLGVAESLQKTYVPPQTFV